MAAMEWKGSRCPSTSWNPRVPGCGRSGPVPAARVQSSCSSRRRPPQGGGGTAHAADDLAAWKREAEALGAARA